MNKGRIIGGLICLAIAVLLGVLHFTLPEEEMMFMVGDTNRSYLPPITLGVVAILLLGMSRR